MSHIASSSGYGFAAGYFLKDDENCVRETATIAANHAQKVTRNGRVIVPMGAIIPSNDANAKGILYEDIDVTDGAHEGSIVTAGTVYTPKLPAAPSADTTSGGTTTAGAKSTLAALGIKFIDTVPSVTRPYTDVVS